MKELDTYQELFNAMATVERLAALCDLDREVAWDHPEYTLWDGDLDSMEVEK